MADNLLQGTLPFMAVQLLLSNGDVRDWWLIVLWCVYEVAEIVDISGLFISISFESLTSYLYTEHPIQWSGSVVCD